MLWEIKEIKEILTMETLEKIIKKYVDALTRRDIFDVHYYFNLIKDFERGVIWKIFLTTYG